MSLGKLLATGRSLVGGAPDSGRYNISSRNRLPKFGAVQNPFAPSATSEPKPANVSDSTPVASESSVAAKPVVDLKVAPALGDKTQRIPELADCPVGSLHSSAAAPSQAGSLLNRGVNALQVAVAVATWAVNKLMHFVKGIKLGAALAVVRPPAVWVWGKVKLVATKLAGLIRKPEPKSVIPRFGKPSAVQTELSLDRVRVVRNSLEDSDLEIVAAPTSTSAVVAPKTPVATAKRGPVPPALKKLTETLLSVKD